MIGLLTLILATGATPSPAQPAVEYSEGAKLRMVTAVERLLTDSEGVPTTLLKGWWFGERDGSRTVCGVASFGAKRSIFMLNTSTRVRVDPGEQEFDRVCSREEQNELR